MNIEITPIQQEKNYTCLPACIRLVLNYLGENKSESEIAKACRTTKAGTLFRDAVTGIQSLGYDVTLIKDGSLNDLVQSILFQKPVIVILGVEQLDYGDFGTHAVVVTGFEDRSVILIDPAFGKVITMELFEFFNSWHSRGKRGILIGQKE